MDGGQTHPTLRQVVLDCTDARGLAEFYRRLLGLRYRPGDEPPAAGPDERGRDWLVLRTDDGAPQLAFQQVPVLPEATWPDGACPQQLHLDTTVPSAAELDVQHERALALGARLLSDRSDDEDEPLRVYADPAGHPFCIFVASRPEPRCASAGGGYSRATTPRDEADEANETSDDQDTEPTMTAPGDVRPDGFAEATEKTRRDDEQSDS